MIRRFLVELLHFEDTGEIRVRPCRGLDDIAEYFFGIIETVLLAFPIKDLVTIQAKQLGNSPSLVDHHVQIRTATGRRFGRFFHAIDTPLGTDVHPVHLTPGGGREYDIRIQIVRRMAIDLLHHVERLR